MPFAFCYFIGVYIIYDTLHGCLEIQNFSFVEKCFLSERSELVKYFSRLEDKIFFISVQPCNILSYNTVMYTVKVQKTL